MYGAAPPIPPPPSRSARLGCRHREIKLRNCISLQTAKFYQQSHPPPPDSLQKELAGSPSRGGGGWGGHGHAAHYLEMGRKWSFPLKKTQ